MATDYAREANVIFPTKFKFLIHRSWRHIDIIASILKNGGIKLAASRIDMENLSDSEGIFTNVTGELVGIVSIFFSRLKESIPSFLPLRMPPLIPKSF